MMLQRMLIHNRFFTVTNAAAIVLALVAAIVNVFVGPLNAAMWLAPVFILGFAAITAFLLQAAVMQAESPIAVNWMVRVFLGRGLGKRIAYCLHRFHRLNMDSVSPVFLYFVPLVFLVLAVFLLIASITGQITPDNH